jgi:hypothetical protein
MRDIDWREWQSTLADENHAEKFSLNEMLALSCEILED